MDYYTSKHRKSNFSGLLRRTQCMIDWPAHTMWHNLLYSGFETCFGPSTQGAGTKTHLKSRFCTILKIKEARCKNLRLTGQPWSVVSAIHVDRFRPMGACNTTSRDSRLGLVGNLHSFFFFISIDLGGCPTIHFVWEKLFCKF